MDFWTFVEVLSQRRESPGLMAPETSKEDAVKIKKINYDWLREEEKGNSLLLQILSLFNCDFKIAVEKGFSAGKSLPDIIRDPDLPENEGPCPQNCMGFVFVPELWLGAIRVQYGLEDKCWIPMAFYESHSGNSCFSLWHYVGGCDAMIIVHLGDNSSITEAMLEGIVSADEKIGIVIPRATRYDEEDESEV